MLRVCNCDERFGAGFHAFAAQAGGAVFGDDDVHVRSHDGDGVGRQAGDDAADLAAFGGGHQGGDGETALREGRAAQEIIQAALAGFLVQQGMQSRELTRCYLANLFPAQAGFRGD